MRKLKFPLVAGGVWLAVALSVAVAQEATPPPAPPLPKPGPAPYSLDLPDLHPQPTNTDLFPDGPRQSPLPDVTAGGNQGAAGGNRRHGGRSGGGGKRRGGPRDQVVGLADADPLEVRVAYRRAKTAAMARDPGLAELIHEAAAAGTDVEKRAYLREYYTRLFASVRRIDSSQAMKSHVALLLVVAQQRYDPKRRAVAGDEDLVNGRGGGGRGRRGR